MKGIKISIAALLLIAVTTNVHLVQCTGEKGNSETGKRATTLSEKKQETPEKTADENKAVKETTTVNMVRGTSEHETLETGIKEESAKKRGNGIKVTFIELGSVKCIPCKMMQPVMKAIEEEYGDQVKVVFYDVWTPEGRPYAQKYGIRGIPTQVFLDSEGKEFYRHTGFFPKEELVKVLQKKGVK